MLGALELVRNKATREPFDSALKVAAYVSSVAQEKGLMTRPLSNCVVFAPPLIIERAQVDLAMDIYSQSLQATLDWLQSSRSV
jgi:adenosylmethionine-8-amino-7-oxononanoate aminotransferase